MIYREEHVFCKTDNALYDLTLLFGKGNEPTEEEFLRMCEPRFTDYSEGRVSTENVRIPEIDDLTYHTRDRVPKRSVGTEWPMDKDCLDCRNYDHENHRCPLDWVSCLSDDNPFNMYEPS